MACCLDGAKPFSEPMMEYCGHSDLKKNQETDLNWHYLDNITFWLTKYSQVPL